jgi:hypothetical protein
LFLLLVVLLNVSFVFGQFTGTYVDASSTVFTSAAGGDMCKAINQAYLSSSFSGTIDARAFTGTQACTVNPFNGANMPVELLLNRTVNIVTSAGWFTPQAAHIIDGGTAAGSTTEQPLQPAGLRRRTG